MGPSTTTLGFIAACLSLASPSAASTRVDGGLIEGKDLPFGIRAWLGVPFAAPPVRQLRWRPPQPVVPWRGVRHTDRFSPECLQPLRSSRQNNYFEEEASSEDCLYLNIWAPKEARNAPVIVYIYGGGFNIGSASMPLYSGEGLARSGVIRVNIAYRGGVLGFLSLPELSRESGYAGSGNYGLMDQIAALHWIQRNIVRFGGDPGNVTVVGQSAGAMSVSLLQTSPLARGLFARLAAMSGSAFGGMLGPVPLEEAERQGLALKAAVGARSLEDLRAMPGDRLVEAGPRRDPLVLDGHVVTDRPERVFAARRESDVPLLIGYTRDEAFHPLDPGPLQESVALRFPTDAPAILTAYKEADPAREARDIARDASVGLQMADWARSQARYGTQPTYAYLFERRHPYTPGVTFSDHDPASVGAYHSGDVAYWLRTRAAFNLLRRTREWGTEDAALEQDMSDALLAFARGGAPTGPAVERWPAFDPAAPRLVVLGVRSAVVPWPHFVDMDLLHRAVVPQEMGAKPHD